MSIVVDASATLALLFDEAGATVVQAAARRALISAVNFDEVLHKGARRGLPFESTLALLHRLEIEIVPFDADQARRSAPLHPDLHRRGIAFGDRACLALAMASGSMVLTADIAWAELDVGLDIRLIR